MNTESPSGPLEGLVGRLRDAARGRPEWRVQDPVTKAYRFSFDGLDGEENANVSLAEHRRLYPNGRFSEYEVAKVFVLDEADRLMLEAADAIAKMQNELEQFRRFETLIVGEGSWGRFKKLEMRVMGYGPHADDYKQLLASVADEGQSRSEQPPNAALSGCCTKEPK